MGSSGGISGSLFAQFEMENEMVDLSSDDEEEEIIQVRKESDSTKEVYSLCLVGCFLTASVIHFSAMKSTMANLWHPTRGVQISESKGEKAFVSIFP